MDSYDDDASYPDAEAVALNGTESRQNDSSTRQTRRRPFYFLLAGLLALTLSVLASISNNAPWLPLLPTFSQQNQAMIDPESFEYPNNLPEIAWMMSLGGSGTSYTVLNAEQMSHRTTASNYGGDYNPCLPVDPESPQGPFIRSPHKPFPDNYILTKTHCGGFCMDCPPASYVYGSDGSDFATACLSGRQRLANGTTVRVTYNSNLPKRAIHLVRAPFDNIVGRMHLGLKHHEQRDHQEELAFGDDQNGFVQWCKYLDDKFAQKEAAADIFEKSGYTDFYAKYGHVPCHAEWFRYIQWHNLAASVTAKLNLPVHYLFYDNYTANFDDTVSRLFDFLELDIVDEPYEWHGQPKTYADYLPVTLQRQAATMMRDLATPDTWKLVGHYLEPYLAEKPEVAWLLSFPNSGTSYTLANVATMTNTTVASNYAKDWDNVVPVRPDLTSGPYLEHPDKSLPNNFILTKSHCAGYCTDCAPHGYVVSLEEFTDGCRRADTPTGEKLYDLSVPKKIVHLIRSPFDNIVARMHLQAKKGKVASDSSKESFDAWCLELDERFRTEERHSNLFADHVKAFFWDLPCHGEWFRYVQWHNRAIELASQQDDMPVHYLYYEDYTDKFDDTVEGLLHFLGQSAVQKPFPFSPGHTYGSFYDDNTARKAAAFCQTMASEQTWSLIRLYFEPWLEDQT